MKRELTLLTVSNKALAADTLPTTLTLLAFGKNPSDRGDVVVDESTIQAINDQRAKGIFDHVIIDFEHNSEKQHPNYQPPPRKHAGVGQVFCNAERGLYLDGIVWTPFGVEFAKSYPDLSPAVYHPKGTLVVDGISSVALVPNGAVKGLSFFDADPAAGAADPLSEMKSQLTALESVIADLRKRLDGMTAPDMAAYQAKIDALDGKLSTFNATVTREFDRRDKLMLVADAARAGKQVALAPDALAALSVEQLTAHIAALPKTVPVSRRTPDVVVEENPEGASVIAQYNAIKDPRERAKFYAEHEAEFSAGK
jgi:hypothetical protein